MKVKLKPETVERILAKRNRPRKWLIARLDTTSGYLSQLMSGTRYPSPELRQKIMVALKIRDFDELFSIKR